MPIYNVQASSNGRFKCNMITHINHLQQTKASTCQVQLFLWLQNAYIHIAKVVEKTPKINTLRWLAVKCMHIM
jgi:hypothetical protein